MTKRKTLAWILDALANDRIPQARRALLQLPDDELLGPRLVHVGLKALEIRAALPTDVGLEKQREALIDIAYTCLNQAEWVGPFDPTDPKWVD